MALSGSLKTSAWTSGSGDKVSLLLTWEATQSISDNTSTVSWKLTGSRGKSGYVMAGGFKVVIDGETVYSKPTDSRIKLYNGTVVATGTKTITHNPNGTRSFGVSVQGGIYTYAVNVTGATSFDLDTIPRASSISCTTAHIGSNPTITISRASPSFTHTITYAFGTLTGTIATKTGAATITSWKLPSTFYPQIPNAKSGEGTLTCITYNGSTELGRSTCKFTATTDEKLCAPVISSFDIADLNEYTRALTGDINTLVRYASTAMYVLEANSRNSADIVSYTINGKPLAPIKNVETGDFTLVVTDSRGYSTSATVNKKLIQYEKLTCNIIARRTDPTSGNATIELTGRCYGGSFGAKSNLLVAQCRRGSGYAWITAKPTVKDNTYSYVFEFTNLDYTQSFNFEISVYDEILGIVKTVTIPKGIPVFDWGEDDFQFNVPVKINGTLTIGEQEITEAQLARLLALIE